MNVMYPFLPSLSEPSEQEGADPVLRQDVRTRIEKAVRHIEPFHLALDADWPLITQHNSKNAGVWLGPTVSTAPSFHNLRGALLAEFDVTMPGATPRQPYNPQLFIGRVRGNQRQLQGISAMIKRSFAESLSQEGHRVKKPLVLDWYVDRISVMERPKAHYPFKVIGTIELGKE
ncbi:hypothetical protein BDW02DRAFT_267615 [Decorospora gaudefroyi]|uniref:Uncharacterized protein n=1 Tax=Decorospora gaudefroyi TaxID=184978 RepID=A0A6A5KJV7_9PLEO|nr:hypothetical protein BDW02DRAFT_267615 [Decorospora gaudefroyi]